MPSHRNCSVIGCSNSYYTILKWNKGHCSIHNDYFGLGRCVCLPPFKLFPFPKHFSTCVKWVQLLRRKEFKLTCDRRICSVHFIDGKPTEENPYPVIKMGYDDLPTAPSGMKCCIKQDVACCSYEAKKKKKRKMQVDINEDYSSCVSPNSPKTDLTVSKFQNTCTSAVRSRDFINLSGESADEDTELMFAKKSVQRSVVNGRVHIRADPASSERYPTVPQQQISQTSVPSPIDVNAGSECVSKESRKAICLLSK